MKKDLYQELRPFVSSLIKFIFNPTINYEEEIPEKENIILAGTHISNFDSLLVATAIKRKINFLAKEEIFKGIMNCFFQNLGCIPVKRDNHDISCLNKSKELLTNNHCIAIFPEGTINKSSDLILPFKLGTIFLAKRCKTDIIPFAITGKYRLIKNNLKICFGKRIKTN